APKAAGPASSSGSPQPEAKATPEKQTDSKPQQPSGAQTAGKRSPEQESRAAAPRRSGGGISILTHLTAGVAGGFLALLLADAVGPQFGLGTRTPPQVVSDLQQRLTAAEQAIRERSAAPSVSPE